MPTPARRPLLLAALSLLLAGAAARPAAAQPALVLLVRHGEKASATDADPTLSAAGEARAAALAAALRDARVDAVVTTQLRRTQLTAAPVARTRGLAPIVVATAGGTAAHARAVAAAVRARPAGETVLVVGHSNTLGPIIAALGGPTVGDLCDGEYGTLFVLTPAPAAPVPATPSAGGAGGSVPPAPARLVRARYGAADAPDPGCPAMAAPRP